MSLFYSFDIFDTCLVRTVARPTDLFYGIFRKVLREAGLSASNERVSELVYQRIQAERRAREQLAKEEIDIDEIYQHFNLECWSLDAKTVLNTELLFEYQSVRPILAILKQIQRLRKAGHRILFISDMYLPSELIREMLVAQAIAEPTDPVYVSNAIGLTKASGNLFKHVLQAEGIQPDQLHHAGDNIISDVVIPKSLDIRATHFQAIQLNRYEQTTLAQPFADVSIRSQLAGISRVTRLAQSAGSADAEDLLAIAGDVIAPLLTSYVLWVLQDAQRQGIERLYFVSRDGQILWKIAQQLGQYRPIPECRYLYGSRQAWFLPSLTTVNRQNLDWLVLKDHSTAPNHLLEKLHIDPVEIADALAQFQFSKTSLAHQLASVEVEKFWQMIESPEVSQLILNKAQAARELALKYFRQEGLENSVNWAIVDVGWTLKCQRSLKQILGQDVKGYYFGILRDRLTAPETGESYAFLIQDAEPESYSISTEQIFRNIHLIEHIFTGADHSTVISYADQSNLVAPIFTTQALEPQQANLVHALQTAVLKYVDELAKTGLSDSELSALKQAAIYNAISFFHRPSARDVQPIAPLKIGGDQNDARLRPVARPLKIQDLLYFAARLARLTKSRDFTAGFSWLEGSITLSSPWIKLLFQVFQRSQAFIRQHKPVWAYQLRYRITQWKR
jgi:predicted HAD superfamily hydrolase